MNLGETSREYEPGKAPVSSAGPIYQYPQGPSDYRGDHRRRAPRRYLILLAIGAVLVTGATIGVGIAVSGDGGSGAAARQKDPGVSFCEAIRDKDQDGPASDSEPMTFEEYEEAREELSGSRYEEISGPAVELVDITWQIEQLGDDAGMEALPLVGAFTDAYTKLTGGCAEHGVQLPPMTP